MKEGRKEMKIGCTYWISTLFWGFIRPLCSEEMSSLTIREQSRLPKKALKCTRRFRWLINPKSVVVSSGRFLSFLLRRCQLANSRPGELTVTKPNHHMCSLLAAAWKKVRSVLWWRLTWDRISLMCRDDHFSEHAPLLSGFSGNFYTFWIYSILFFLFPTPTVL